MAITNYVKTALTGGTSAALDSVDGAPLLDGDRAFVCVANVLYYYLLDDDSAAAEASPRIISPDTNAGDKRWILQKICADGATISGGTNTFNLTNGTASLDVAAGAAVDIDAELHVEAATHVNQDLTTDAGPTFDHVHLAGGQLAFPAAQSASADPNTLDDYEEGTWEAAMVCGTSGTITLLAANNLGSYTKIGRAVTVCGGFTVDSVSSPVGALTITGLPFANQQGSEQSGRTAVSVWAFNLETTGATQMMAYIEEGESAITISHFAAGTAADAAADIKAGSVIMVNATFFI